MHIYPPWWSSGLSPYFSFIHLFILKRREECDTYLTHIHRDHCSGEAKYTELSAKTVAFISCRQRVLRLQLTKKKKQSWLKVPYILSFHWALSATVIYIDMSHAGITLFPSF